MAKWTELPPTVQWLVGLGAAFATLCGAYNYGSDLLDEIIASRVRHEMVDRDVPKIPAQEAQLQKLTEIVEQNTTQTRAAGSYLTLQHESMLTDCECGDRPERACVRWFDYNGLENTYGSKTGTEECQEDE